MTLNPLHVLADRGPWVLVAGIAAGAALPALAAQLQPLIPIMVAGLLFLSSLRIGGTRMVAAFANWPQSLGIIAVLQLVFPLCLIFIFSAFDLLQNPYALALLLIAMAPSISGAPNMLLMMGYDLTEAMRFLIVGTAVLPITVIPMLFFLPEFGSVLDVIFAALRLFAVIVIASVAALLLRRSLPAFRTGDLKTIDGASALLLAVLVIGLMSAVNEAIRERPAVFLGWLGFVLIVNFGLQLIGYFCARQRVSPDARAALTVIAGNRNIALFLVTLPETVTGPLLVFIGCYQIPMYLTPLVTGRFLKGARL